VWGGRKKETCFFETQKKCNQPYQVIRIRGYNLSPHAQKQLVNSLIIEAFKFRTL
jgi:hypothetical protein